MLKGFIIGEYLERDLEFPKSYFDNDAEGINEKLVRGL
jgi:hypothetical protein